MRCGATGDTGDGRGKGRSDEERESFACTEASTSQEHKHLDSLHPAASVPICRFSFSDKSEERGRVASYSRNK